MKKALFWIIGIVAVVGLVIFNQAQQTPDSGKRKVYAVLPLTGQFGVIGEDIKKTMELYLEQHPDASFQLQFVDSKSSPMEAITAIRKELMQADKPIVISAIASISNAVTPVVSDAGGLTIFIGSAETSALKGQNFQTASYNYETVSIPQARYMAKRYKNIAVLYSETDFGLGGYQSFKKEYEKDGGTILITEAFNPQELDAHNLALKILDKKPESIFLIGSYSAGYRNVIKSLKLYGYDGFIFTDVAYSMPAMYQSLTPEEQKNVVFSTVDLQLEEPQTTAGKERKKILEANNLELSHVPNDTLNVMELVDTLVANNYPITQESILNNVKKINDMTFLPNSENQSHYILATIKNGKIIPFEDKEN